MKVCLFCRRARTLTSEHVYPKWLRTLYPEGARFVTTLVDEGKGERKPFEGKEPNAKVKVVCASCNNGWMSALEDKMKPLLTPMIKGEAVSLSADDLRVAAFWAAKTAIVMAHLGEPKVAVAVEQCTWLHDRGEPPPATFAWLGTYEGEPGPNERWQADLRRLVPPTQQGLEASPSALDWTAGIGRLLLKVILLPPALWPDPVEIDCENDGSLVRIWPSPSESISTPLPLTFQERDRQALSRALMDALVEIDGQSGGTQPEEG